MLAGNNPNSGHVDKNHYYSMSKEDSIAVGIRQLPYPHCKVILELAMLDSRLMRPKVSTSLSMRKTVPSVPRY